MIALTKVPKKSTEKTMEKNKDLIYLQELYTTVRNTDGINIKDNECFAHEK